MELLLTGDGQNGKGEAFEGVVNEIMVLFGKDGRGTDKIMVIFREANVNNYDLPKAYIEENDINLLIII